MVEHSASTQKQWSRIRFSCCNDFKKHQQLPVYVVTPQNNPQADTSLRKSLWRRNQMNVDAVTGEKVCHSSHC